MVDGMWSKREVLRIVASYVPFPLDHFFFCFLPAAAAAGA